MYKNSKGQWTFVFCPKTYNFENYCPFCAATMKLYQGSKEDKRSGYNYKRKRKHVVNAHIIKDPRDAEAEEDKDKSGGKTLIYEFPDTVESKIRSEMQDEEYGNGMNIFDPGEDGVDFILKVGATKPIQEEGPNKGKSFPDYSDSKFANKSYPLAKDDSVIEEIMEKTHDLDEYLKSMERKEEDLISMVKDEMLWELISQDVPTSYKPGPEKAESSDEMDDVPFGEDEQKSEQKQEDDENIDESDLLAELDNL
jgi:thiol-disulfide isomerase/thioredoxin